MSIFKSQKVGSKLIESLQSVQLSFFKDFFINNFIKMIPSITYLPDIYIIFEQAF